MWCVGCLGLQVTSSLCAIIPSGDRMVSNDRGKIIVRTDLLGWVMRSKITARDHSKFSGWHLTTIKIDAELYLSCGTLLICCRDWLDW